VSSAVKESPVKAGKGPQTNCQRMRAREKKGPSELFLPVILCEIRRKIEEQQHGPRNLLEREALLRTAAGEPIVTKKSHSFLGGTQNRRHDRVLVS